ncbi:DUF2283 domain-containing protein [Streptomyces sp. NPDC095817]|uniref:DUF2283 domain-containing protein n=1 Tax=Streptomyces sp. NPDC095817 TaxID=3155082 RepID=UPI003333BB9F
MTEVKVTYDKTADAAYVHLTEPQTPVKSAYMYPCDPVDADGMINLDFDKQGRLIGIEILAASTKLPTYLLQTAKRLDAEGTAEHHARSEQAGAGSASRRSEA